MLLCYEYKYTRSNYIVNQDVRINVIKKQILKLHSVSVFFQLYHIIVSARPLLIEASDCKFRIDYFRHSQLQIDYFLNSQLQIDYFTHSQLQIDYL